MCVLDRAGAQSQHVNGIKAQVLNYKFMAALESLKDNSHFFRSCYTCDNIRLTRRLPL